MRADNERDMALVCVLQQPLWTATPDGTVDYANPYWTTYTGLSASAWRRAIHPDDLPTVDRWHRDAATAAGHEAELRFRRADGVDRWHLARVAAIRDPHGVLTGWVGTAIDVDDRRRAEEALRASEARYRDLVEDASEIVYTLDLDGIITSINPAVERLAGYKPEELIGLPVDSFIVPEDIAGSDEMLRRKVEGRERTFYELQVMARDGRRITLEIDSRLALVDGQPAAIHGIARDVSARRAGEELLQRFLEALSHDLKNPLAVAKARTQRLRRDVASGAPIAPAELDRTLGAIEAATARMEAHLDDLQDVATLRAGRELELVIGRTDLRELVASVVADCQASTRAHEFRIEAALEPIFGAWDGQRLRRVFDNLLGNAIKYSPRGGRITLMLAREERVDGAWATISVRDPGVGIPAAEQEAIFERYRRASNVAGQIAGTGIGLSGARQIVEQHGGTITVASTEGKGSTFTVSLPLDRR